MGGRRSRSRDRRYRSEHRREDRGSNKHRRIDKEERDKYRDRDGRQRRKSFFSSESQSSSKSRKKKVDNPQNKRKRSYKEDSEERRDRKLHERSPTGERGMDRDRKGDRPEENKTISSDESISDGPCFIPSGILARYANTVNGVELKFTEPLDSCFPETLWQIFPFKGTEEFDVIVLDNKTCYLVGKDPRVADIRVENPTCSMQHAVIQFRQVSVQALDGTYRSEIRPYLMDLNSTNGTYLNGSRIESQKYYQLLQKDIVKFGNSEREYVFMHDPAEKLEENMLLNKKA